MLVKKGQWPILISVAVMLLAFGAYYIATKNYEFMMYIAVILIIFYAILVTNSKVSYSNTSLWGLAFWGLLHMSGGSLRIAGTRLYDLMLIPITTDVFRFDQFVHIVGFAVATLVMYELIQPLLKPNHKWAALSVVVVMAGLGVGAVNEIVEFTATLLMENNGVGGYMNTSLDLVSDLIGAMITMVFIRIKNK